VLEEVSVMAMFLERLLALIMTMVVALVLDPRRR
jgi:hypothetical protein